MTLGKSRCKLQQQSAITCEFYRPPAPHYNRPDFVKVSLNARAKILCSDYTVAITSSITYTQEA